MNRLLLVALMFIIGCAELKTPMPVPNIRGCVFYCYPDDAATNLLVSLCRTNGTQSACWTGGVLYCHSNDVVTATFSQLICTNQPMPVVTFVWICSNKVYSVDKQLPSNSYDVDWQLANNCQDCSWSVTTTVASHCDQNGPQFILERGVKADVLPRRKTL